MNVAFGEDSFDVPDRMTGLQSLSDLKYGIFLKLYR
jgi:hypothetical protein